MWSKTMRKLMMVMFILLWFGSPKFAQGQSSTSTCSTRLEAACATDPLVVTTCCATLSNEIQSDDKVCICTEINYDVSSSIKLLGYCGLPVDIITVCQGVSTTPDTPSQASPYYTPPGYNNNVSGQKTKTNNNIIYIVVPIAAVAVLITVAVSVFCICRGQRIMIIPNVTNDPYNGNVYTDLKRNNGYLPSDHASVPIDMSNVPPSLSPTTDDTPQYEFSTFQADTNNFSENAINLTN